MAELKEKLMSMSEAVSLIPNGSRIAVGGGAIHAHPMAFLREMIKQKKRDMTVVGSLNGLDIDILAGANVLKRVETSCVSLERYGLAKNFRRGVENNKFEIVDYSDYSAFNRFVASVYDLPFWPCDYLGGSDIPKYNPEIKKFSDPMTGRQMFALPPAKVDYAIIHAAAADVYGNIMMPTKRLFTQADDLLFARAAKYVFVTVERIIPNDLVRKNSYMVDLHKYKTTGVIKAPYGAHPCSMPQFYDVDDVHFRNYMEFAESGESFNEYLDEYVFNLKDQYAYLTKIGIENLTNLNLPTFI